MQPIHHRVATLLVGEVVVTWRQVDAIAYLGVVRGAMEGAMTQAGVFVLREGVDPAEGKPFLVLLCLRPAAGDQHGKGCRCNDCSFQGMLLTFALSESQSRSGPALSLQAISTLPSSWPSPSQRSSARSRLRSR